MARKHKLKGLVITAVSLVDAGSNAHARVVLYKRKPHEPTDTSVAKSLAADRAAIQKSRDAVAASRAARAALMEEMNMESPEGLPAVRKSVERGVRVTAEAIEGAVEELADALSTHTGITLEDARDRVFAKSVNPHRRSDGTWADAWRAAKDAESPAVAKAQSGEASAMAEIDQLTDQFLRQHPQATRAVAVSAVLATHRGASAYRKYCDSQRAVARARSAR